MSDLAVPRLEKLTSQPEVEKLLKGLLAQGSVQSYIWAGPEGTGKKTHALAMVRTLFCQEGSDCPGCAVCKQVLSKSHPDLFWVERAEGKNEISVDDILNLNKKLSNAPLSAPCKVAIVPEGDRINESAQNVFLKTLEEPPANTIIILIASKTSKFLPTVLSRCRLVRFAALPDSTVQSILVQTHGWSPADAQAAAEEANGNLTLALKAGDSSWTDFRKKVCEDMDRALQGKDPEWLKLVSEYDQWEPDFLGDEEMTATQRKSQVHQAILQVYLNLWSRRLMGKAPVPAGLSGLPPEQVLRCLQKHQDMIPAYLGTRMIMDHLFLELREGLKTGQIDERSFMELAVQI